MPKNKISKVAVYSRKSRPDETDEVLQRQDVNHLLSSLVDHVEYKRVGDHKAKIEIKIHYKG